MNAYTIFQTERNNTYLFIEGKLKLIINNEKSKVCERRGVETWQSWIIALSGKGHWRKSGCPQVHQAMIIGYCRKVVKFEVINIHSEPFFYLLFDKVIYYCI